jgi:hypothetical protein
VINTVKVIKQNSSFNIAGNPMMGGTGAAVHYPSHMQCIGADLARLTNNITAAELQCES